MSKQRCNSHTCSSASTHGFAEAIYRVWCGMAWQDMLREMKEEMKEADIPSEYGGQSTIALYDSYVEKQLLEFVKHISE